MFFLYFVVFAFAINLFVLLFNWHYIVLESIQGLVLSPNGGDKRTMGHGGKFVKNSGY